MAQDDQTLRSPVRQPFRLYAANGRIYARNRAQKVIDLGALMRFSSFLLAVFAALTCGALFIMRRRGMTSAYRTPLYPLPPLVFIAVSVWIAYAQFKANPRELAVALGVLVVGAVLYAVLVKRPAAAVETSG